MKEKKVKLLESVSSSLESGPSAEAKLSINLEGDKLIISKA